MATRPERRIPTLVVVDRGDLGDAIERIAKDAGLGVEVARYTSVLDVVGENGPSTAAAVICTVGSAGPFLQDLLRWTDREHGSRIPAAVIGERISATTGR